MPDSTFTPTALQSDQAALAQVEVLELFARLEKEGVDWRVTLAGAQAAISAVVAMQLGAAAVPGWFTHMAATSRHLAQPE